MGRVLACFAGAIVTLASVAAYIVARDEKPTPQKPLCDIVDEEMNHVRSE